MKKILVIDDQPDNVFILQDRLEKEGFEVLTAYDGEAGIKKAIELSPDLILLDIMMPGISGLEVCLDLTNRMETKNIPIILVTALNDANNLQEGFKAGAFDYVKKPFNRVELIARINAALRFRDANNLLLEVEKMKTYAATIVTANHEIKQPLTLINLSITAVKRELNKESISKDAIQKRVEIISDAGKKIIEILDKLSNIKKPIIVDYLNNMKMIDLSKDGLSELDN
ncbi:MAG: response regulator [Melioribacteraceae bacterium]|nr:response regulator [Melioribacteraceae bacterium]MCF8356108.1 response regulator [Melioribacteraceae bacterium]MCF8395592.1 response regulator [Melioribacteraceae bacterium]MCF8419694.1 response regulator [Melioribacteraceae bacterium]